MPAAISKTQKSIKRYSQYSDYAKDEAMVYIDEIRKLLSEDTML
jgi:hypothetical protein